MLCEVGPHPYHKNQCSAASLHHLSRLKIPRPHHLLRCCSNEQNPVYLYEFSGDHYYVARGETHNREWLVIFGESGLMETAFPPEDIDDYIERRGFVLLGRIDEVLKWAEEENK